MGGGEATGYRTASSSLRPAAGVPIQYRTFTPLPSFERRESLLPRAAGALARIRPIVASRSARRAHPLAPVAGAGRVARLRAV